MKIFLDDERETPDGWVRCFWPDEVIEHLYAGNVSEVSLDHDLGDDDRGTGYDVLLWIEEAVADFGWSPPKLGVHSANSPARQKMEAAIAQISKLAEAHNYWEKHHERGNFLISWDGAKPAWFAGENAEPIMLKESAGASRFFELGDGTLLGSVNSWRCYQEEFQKAGWRRPLIPGPMSIWNGSTGERILALQGHHFGEVKGAEILEDGRLITWGRDYLLRVWDQESGACKDVIPLPLWPDPHNKKATLSCNMFTQMKPSEKKRYVDTRHLPAPDIEIDWITVPGAPQRSFRYVVENRSEQNIVKPWEPSLTEHGAHRILDVADAEAGYSTWDLLADGRLLGGGTTYGTSGLFYVWDGMYRLRLLIVGRSDCNMHLKGEIAPNTILLENLTGMESVDAYKFVL
jgi:hypothetical protein